VTKDDQDPTTAAEIKVEPVLQNTVVRFGVVVGALALLAAALLLLEQAYVNPVSSNYTNTVAWNSLRETYATNVRTYALELVAGDNRTWSSRSEIRTILSQTISNLTHVNQIVKYGSKALGVLKALGFNQAMTNIYDSEPGILPDNVTCSGFDPLLVRLEQEVAVLVNVSDAELSATTPSHLNALFLCDQILPRTKQAVDIFLLSHVTTIGIADTVLSAFFAVAVVLVFLSTFIFRPSLGLIRQETERTKRMLLMLPLHVIDGIPMIREFLGDIRVTTTITGELEQSVARNRLIIGAAADGVVVISQEGIIEMFNHAAVFV